MGSMAAYGLLCALAAVCAAFSVREKDWGAFPASLAIFCGWSICAPLTWSPYAIHIWVPGLSYADVWAITDLLVASIILATGGTRWWSLSLAGVLWLQIALHTLHQYAGIEFAPYSVALDTLFLAQLAIIFTTGGGKIVDLVSRAARHAADVLRPAAPASRQEK